MSARHIGLARRLAEGRTHEFVAGNLESLGIVIGMSRLWQNRDRSHIRLGTYPFRFGQTRGFLPGRPWSSYGDSIPAVTIAYIRRQKAACERRHLMRRRLLHKERANRSREVFQC